MLQNKRKRIGLKWTGLMLVLALAVMSLAACGGNKENNNAGNNVPTGDPEKIVATYKNGEVNEQQFNQYYSVDKIFNTQRYMYEQLDPNFKEGILKEYIAFQILQERASEDIHNQATSETDEWEKQFDKNLEESEDFQLSWKQTSQQLGISKEDMKQYVFLRNVVLDSLHTLATDAKLQETYDQALADNPNAYEVATVGHILIMFEPEGAEKRTNEEALKLANEVKKMLDEGADFAETAKQYSEDGGSKDSGGRYVDWNVNSWVEPFKEAAIELPLNTISEPVETTYGYHVMKVESRHKQSLDEVKPELEGTIINDAFSDFMTNELDDLITNIQLPEPANTDTETADNTETPAAE